jgi:hypothetical protein
MSSMKTVAAVTILFAVCQGISFAQQFTIKKDTIRVVVEDDKNCRQGMSVSGIALGGHHLCADYPEGISREFKKLVGLTVEVKASWTFGADAKNIPIALGEVLSIQDQQSKDRRPSFDFFCWIPSAADDVVLSSDFEIPSSDCDAFPETATMAVRGYERAAK